jgi:hypothetical protein
MVVMTAPDGTLRPARVCTALLAALNASDGRRRARKRDQTPDSVGLALRRELLIQAAHDDPEPDAFEQWLLEHWTNGIWRIRCPRSRSGSSAVHRAMTRTRARVRIR